MKKLLLIMMLFFFLLGKSFAHNPCCFAPFYIVDRFPCMPVYDTIPVNDIRSVDILAVDYNVEGYNNEKDTLYCNCKRKPLEYLNQKINKDLNSEDTKIPTYIINDKVVDFKMFKALMSNISLKQVHAFLILNDCKNLQELLDVDVSNGLVLIYTK